MNLSSFYPVIATQRLAESRDFYMRLFGFELTFEADWYVSLRRPGPPAYELGLLDPTHPTVPVGYGKSVEGLLLNFEVEDVDAVWQRLVAVEGLEPALAICSEEWGQRHFIVPDPSGVLIDVITPIESNAEYAEQYVAAE